MTELRAYTLPEVRFKFGAGTSTSKFNGLVKFGPLEGLPLDRQPRFGFVFPDEYRDYANHLFRSLKNGIGYFKGVERTFKFRLSIDQVYPVTGFTLQGVRDEREKARMYVNAILQSVGEGTPTDMFFVLHDRTAKWLNDTPYYETKAVLLQHGILSQDVTVDLLRDKRQFEWSVGNIALASFVKMGGVPWAIEGVEGREGLIIGVGRSDVFDPEQQQAVRYVGFTSCFGLDGRFEFTALADQARTREDYLVALDSVVRRSISRATKKSAKLDRIVLHVPKQFGRDEWKIIDEVAADSSGRVGIPVYVAKVVSDDNYFVVDDSTTDGLPPAGLVANIGESDYVLYTEGAQERRSWINRTPTSLRITVQNRNVHPTLEAELVEQVYALSQVNWRGFNAASTPITTAYSSLIARILAHAPVRSLGKLNGVESRKLLDYRPWFI